jgi:hypothetical protein
MKRTFALAFLLALLSFESFLAARSQWVCSFDGLHYSSRQMCLMACPGICSPF